MQENLIAAGAPPEGANISVPPDPLADGEGLAAPALGPSGLAPNPK